MADALCYDDLDEFGGELDDPLEELAQDLYHRIVEPYGSNIDDEDRGLGIEGRLSGVVDASLKTDIETELSKDDRVQAVRATISKTADGEYRIDIEIKANERTLGIALEGDAGGVRRVQ